MIRNIFNAIFAHKKILFTVIAVLFIVIFIYIKQEHIKSLIFKSNSQSRVTTWKNNALWLDDYRVVIENKAINNVKNLSSLTFNADTNTLYSITNKQPEIIELTLTGEVIRRIDATIFSDPESIAYLGNNRYVVADEAKQQISIINILPETETITHIIKSLSIKLEYKNNKGFEGVTYDPSTQSLFIAQEKDPYTIYKINGFYLSEENENKSLSIKQLDSFVDHLFVTDFSGLEFDPIRSHLFVLSDESKMLIELNKKGEAISLLTLNKDHHDLSNDVPQPEGVAIANDESIYIISEPNLFYKFVKDKK